MSNSIWKTPDQKPDKDQQILFFAGGGDFPYLGFYYERFDYFQDWKSDDVQKWCDIDDLIAQADKAERLQETVEYVYKLLLEETNFTAGVHLPNKYQQKIFEVIRQAIKENQ